MITAPIRVAKKTLALKVAGAKAIKAVKVAKVAKSASFLTKLKKSPLILPVKVAVPVKSLRKPIPVPVAPPVVHALPPPVFVQEAYRPPAIKLPAPVIQETYAPPPVIHETYGPPAIGHAVYGLPAL